MKKRYEYGVWSPGQEPEPVLERVFFRLSEDEAGIVLQAVNKHGTMIKHILRILPNGKIERIVGAVHGGGLDGHRDGRIRFTDEKE